MSTDTSSAAYRTARRVRDGGSRKTDRRQHRHSALGRTHKRIVDLEAFSGVHPTDRMQNEGLSFHLDPVDPPIKGWFSQPRLLYGGRRGRRPRTVTPSSLAAFSPAPFFGRVLPRRAWKIERSGQTRALTGCHRELDLTTLAATRTEHSRARKRHRRRATRGPPPPGGSACGPEACPISTGTPTGVQSRPQPRRTSSVSATIA